MPDPRHDRVALGVGLVGEARLRSSSITGLRTQNARLDRALLQHPHQLRGVRLDHLHLRAGKVSSVRSSAVGKICRLAEVRPDAHRNARRVLAADLLEVTGDALALVQHHPARAAPARARERQRRRALRSNSSTPSIALEPPDALRQRRLADVQQRCGRAAGCPASAATRKRFAGSGPSRRRPFASTHEVIMQAYRVLELEIDAYRRADRESA